MLFHHGETPLRNQQRSNLAGCSANTARHFAAHAGKPVAFQFWFQLSEENGLSSASRSTPHISPGLRRESSQHPTPRPQFQHQGKQVSARFSNVSLPPLPPFPPPSICIPAQELGAAWQARSILSASCRGRPALHHGSRPGQEPPSLKAQIPQNFLPQRLPETLFAKPQLCSDLFI